MRDGEGGPPQQPPRSDAELADLLRRAMAQHAGTVRISGDGLSRIRARVRVRRRARGWRKPALVGLTMAGVTAAIALPLTLGGAHQNSPSGSAAAPALRSHAASLEPPSRPPSAASGRSATPAQTASAASALGTTTATTATSAPARPDAGSPGAFPSATLSGVPTGSAEGRVLPTAGGSLNGAARRPGAAITVWPYPNTATAASRVGIDSRLRVAPAELAVRFVATFTADRTGNGLAAKAAKPDSHGNLEVVVSRRDTGHGVCAVHLIRLNPGQPDAAYVVASASNPTLRITSMLPAGNVSTLTVSGTSSAPRSGAVRVAISRADGSPPAAPAIATPGVRQWSATIVPAQPSTTTLAVTAFTRDPQGRVVDFAAVAVPH